MNSPLTMQMTDTRTGKKTSVDILSTAGAIFLRHEGFGDKDDTWPIMLEVYDGKVRVVAWNDKDEDDPVIVDLEKARRT